MLPGLVDAAQQHRDIFELHASPPLDLRQDEFGEIGIRTAEIELEFELERCGHRKPFLPDEAAVRRPLSCGI
jgi:hypothetical protein